MEMKTKDSHKESISKDFEDLSMSDEGVRQFLPSTMYTIGHLSQVKFSEFGKELKVALFPKWLQSLMNVTLLLILIIIWRIVVTHQAFWLMLWLI